MTAAPQSIQPTTASERDQIVARLADLQAKQEAATGWGAAVGAREEEIRSLESRLLRIDAMTAPPSTETPRRHTATPWALFHANGTIAITNPRSHSSKNEIVFWTGFDASHYPKEALANAAFIVTAVNSHAALTAKVAELEAELRNIGACALAGYYLNGEETWQQLADQIGRFNSELQKRVKLARAALDNADGGRGT